MPLIENLKVESAKSKGLILTWDWGAAATSRVDITNCTAVVELFYPNDVLVKSIQLTNPKSSRFIFKYMTDSNLKICLNISTSETVSSSSVDYPYPFKACISYTADNWLSVPMSLGSSFAAFVVLLLIVCLIFLTQKLGKKRRVMDKKTSIKRKPRESFIYLYGEMKEVRPDQSDKSFSGNQERKVSAGNATRFDFNGPKIDIESVDDVESIDSLSKGESMANVHNDEYEIIKCDCGLIHLVGTEVECDDFLQKPVFYSQHVPLAPQDTISIESNSSL